MNPNEDMNDCSIPEEVTSFISTRGPKQFAIKDLQDYFDDCHDRNHNPVAEHMGFFIQAYNELTEAAIYSHPPSKAGPSSDEECDYDDDASWGAKKKPAKRRKSVTLTSLLEKS